MSWKSAKQKTLAASTMEAEFIACFEATKRKLWLKNLISFMATEYVDTILRPLIIYCDNNATVVYSKNNKKSEATKLTDIKYLSVKEHVRKGEVMIEHIETNLAIASGPLP